MSRAGFGDVVSWAVRTRTVWPGGRWVLLLAVLAGLFGMHVLTAESADGGHGSLPAVSAHAGHSMPNHTPDSMPDSMLGSVGAAASAGTAVIAAPHPTLPDAVSWMAGALAGVSVAPADSGGMPADHGGLGGCVLFLIVGGTLLLLLALSGRARLELTAAWLPALMAWGRVRRRGPPGQDRPRVALCVIRV